MEPATQWLSLRRSVKFGTVFPRPGVMLATSRVGVDLQWYGINVWVYNNNDPAYLHMKKIGRLANWSTAGSLHTGGCQALLADGSVRFLSENIDAGTRANLHYRADGNVIGEF